MELCHLGAGVSDVQFMYEVKILQCFKLNCISVDMACLGEHLDLL